MFEDIWDVDIQQGGKIAYHQGLISNQAEAIGIALVRARADIPHANDIAEATMMVYERMEACYMLSGADN